MDSDLLLTDELGELGMHLDVPFVPTDERVVKAMLEMGDVDADDVLYDLGSGDGRIVVAAARDHGAQAVGVEMDPGRVAEAEEYAAQMGVDHMVSFIEGDLFLADFGSATVVTLYLLHTANLDLRPRLLRELRPGARIVSHAFDMGDWKPDRRAAAGGISIYLWIVPARVAGTWLWQSADGRQYRVALEQTYQRVRGEAWVSGEPVRLKAAVLWGDLMELIIRHPDRDEPESIIMHCQGDQLVVVGQHQHGSVARKVVE